MCHECDVQIWCSMQKDSKVRLGQPFRSLNETEITIFHLHCPVMYFSLNY